MVLACWHVSCLVCLLCRWGSQDDEGEEVKFHLVSGTP